jgi:hypothetical protein
MDVCVCVYSVFMLSCVKIAALQWADHSSKESYRLCRKDYETEIEAGAQQRVAEPLMNEWIIWLIFVCLFLFIICSTELLTDWLTTWLLSYAMFSYMCSRLCNSIVCWLFTK